MFLPLSLLCVLLSSEVWTTSLWEAFSNHMSFHRNCFQQPPRRDGVAGRPDADLSGANLEGVEGVTTEELEEQTESLKDATMPDGSEHE
jgi:hypothetical protein